MTVNKPPTEHHTAKTDPAGLFKGEEFERNHIGGSWRFPRAPYELEIFSPATSDVLATVPFSSRFDVADAVDAASRARSTWADPATRAAALGRFRSLLSDGGFELAERQAHELGLDQRDSSTLVAGSLALVERLGVDASEPDGVTGYILSWGSPVIEVAVSVLPDLFAGRTVVVKPSIRAPLTVASMISILIEADLPDGVVNLVQGQGTDVGSAMVAEDGVDTIVVRGSSGTVRSVAAACRRRERRVKGTAGAEQHLVIGRDADDEELAAMEDAVITGIRANSAGGPLGIHHVHAHRAVARTVAERLCRRLDSVTPAPLVNDAARRKTMAITQSWMTADDAGLIAGSLIVPDDRTHRMGWFLPPAIVFRGSAPLSEPAPAPAGPVLAWSVFDADPTIASAGADSSADSRPGHASSQAVHAVVGADLEARVATGDLTAGWYDREAS